jgi:hypothetical protein
MKTQRFAGARPSGRPVERGEEAERGTVALAYFLIIWQYRGKMLFMNHMRATDKKTSLVSRSYRID